MAGRKGADVEGFLRELRHARMDEVLAVRAVVAAARPGLVEGVKWDSSGLVAWAAPDRGVVTFTGMDDVRSKAEALRDLVDRWVRATT